MLIGRKLSHYRIVARLGAGGMGEVYRAEDERLGRAVALKILPPEFAADARRLARFRREARILGGLDHPHIVTVFSIEQEADPPFLTMELVEGGTLADEVPRRGFGIERFFALAIPLVDAVATAHAAGVVHRDLKPDNVMIGKDGRIKVLDFGLAKPEDEASGFDPDGSTVQLTAEGKVLGTVAYMSPEQLRGEPADARSDIFSLGILLYLMATGRGPFSGSSSVDLMSSILREQPPPATEIKAELPPHLAGILGRCLDKDPDERFQSARDLRFALEQLDLELRRGEAVPSASEVGRPRRPLARPWLWVAAAAVAAGALGLWLGRRGEPAPRRPDTEVQIAAPIVTWPSEEGMAGLSPDGEWLAFVSDRGGTPGLWIQRADGGEAHALVPGGRPVLSFAWSPAGDQVVALTRDDAGTRLETVAAPLGGSPRLSLPAPSANHVVEWLGRRVYLEDGARLLRFELDSGEWDEVAIPDADFEFRRHYGASADGTKIVFSAVRGGREDIWLFELERGRMRQLTDDDAKAIDPICLGASCERVVYLSNRTGQSDVWILDRASGSSRQLRVPAAVKRLDSVSRDGALIALRVVDENADLWRYDLAGGDALPLTADTLADFWPSPAAAAPVVAFQRSRPSTESQSPFLDARILVARMGDAGLSEPRPLGDGGYAPTVSPDGRRVAYLRTSASGLPPYFTELWVGEIESGRTRQVSRRFQAIGFFELPAGLVARSLAWRGPGELLFAEADEGLAPRLSSLDLDSPSAEPRQLAALEPMTQLRHLFVSPAGEVAWSSEGLRTGRAEIWVLGAGGEARVVYSRAVNGAALRLLGRRGPEGAWILSLSPRAAHLPGAVEIVEVNEGAGPRTLGTIDGGYASTAELAPAGDAIYLTAVSGDRHQLVAFSLARGKTRVLVPNTLPGVTFCGIAPLIESIIFSRQRRNADLWLLRLGAESARS